ncbi:hypothetical protein HCN44_011450 [Aphidius gifuensis]|uniref:Uncharacterized protein n=1 Tax=Aphidius gifuensis TaxID=684658 RepID=A0A834XWQ4_APHGI|nr:uncharacterized protein LOC122851573 [Aphidius gifuensis]KAF7994181.1 hypothetical protein HCN44_011450 [Aphidius gifuensis]
MFEEIEIFNEFFPVYSWWSSIMILQMMTLIWFTGRIRVKTETIHSDEDKKWIKNKNVELHIDGGGHPDLDHIRSAHFTDLKTMMPYLLIAPIWLTTSPTHFSANIILRIFPICKLIDTILYMKLNKNLTAVPAIFLTVCYVVIFYIGTSTLLHYLY